MAGLGDATYVNLATFRRDGREVRTPVWVAAAGDKLIVWTNINAGKVKRLRNGSRVRIAACDVRGKVHGDWHEGHGRVLEDPAERDRALEAIFDKYGWQMQLARIGGTLSGRWQQRGAIEITLD
jgi:PPOX class probable F420-dependent enzyme